MSVTKLGLKGNSISNDNRKQNKSSNTGDEVGKVYAIVTTENTPTPAMYKKAGGASAIGSIFYLLYNSSKNTPGDLSDGFLDTCKISKPYEPYTQYYPLIGELVEIKQAPSVTSQLSQQYKPIFYWSKVINLWGNQQHNSQTTLSNASLGKTFEESSTIKNLLAYEGDFILSGRKGNAVRFGTTVRYFSNSSNINYNEWSSIGNNGDPIVLITNGHAYTSTPNINYVEQINKDLSSIYLTSTQAIQLTPDKQGEVNQFTKPTEINKYFSSQVILNGDRIVLNSKKDEVMIYAKTNIELNTKNIINLNADRCIHLNSDKIYLGKGETDNYPDEPVLLGYKTINLITDLLDALNTFSNSMSPSVGVPQGMVISQIKIAADTLAGKTEKLLNRLEPDAKEYIASNKIYVS